jgi:hypothetical protein
MERGLPPAHRLERNRWAGCCSSARGMIRPVDSSARMTLGAL